VGATEAKTQLNAGNLHRRLELNDIQVAEEILSETCNLVFGDHGICVNFNRSCLGAGRYWWNSASIGLRTL
jgi:hypothetical protein